MKTLSRMYANALPNTRRLSREYPQVVAPHALAVFPSTGISWAQMESIFFMPVTTAWGPCGVVWRRRASPTDAPRARLMRVFPAYRTMPSLRSALRKEFPAARLLRSNTKTIPVPRWLVAVRRFLMDYYNMANGTGKPHPIDFSHLARWLDWSRTSEFDRRVLQAVADIAPGATISYGELARRIARPRAARAVGAALARNPWPVLIGCHRVLGADGAMTGFSGPGRRHAKKRMLLMEQSGLRRTA